MTDDHQIDFSPLIARHTDHFVGRTWLRAEIDRFTADSDPSTLLLTAEPGFGKTALSAQLVKERRPLHHFVDSQLLDWLSPEAFLQSLGAQLAERYGLWILADEEATAKVEVDQEIGAVAAGATVIGVVIREYVGLPVEELARRLVLQPLRRLAARAEPSVLLLVDGIDEAAAYSGRPTIADLLAQLATEPNLRVVATANPGMAQERFVARLSRPGLTLLHPDEQSGENRQDLQRYTEAVVADPILQAELAAADLSMTEFITAAVDRSDGNFLYLVTMLQALRQAPVSFDLRTLPAGLSEFYRLQFLRVRDEVGSLIWRREYRPVIGVLCVARSPLTTAQLADLAEVDRDLAAEVIDLCRLLIEERTGDGAAAYGWYHGAVADFLTSQADNPDDWFDRERYHRQIADRLHARFPDAAAIDESYALNSLAHHDRLGGSETIPRLFAMVTPAVRTAWRSRSQSDDAFRRVLTEAVEAAATLAPQAGLPELVRCGLIDATLSELAARVPAELLRVLAHRGQADRALRLARAQGAQSGADLLAIVEGLLDRHDEADTLLARQLAGQIPPTADHAHYRSLALAKVGAALAEPDRAAADTLFALAHEAVADVSGLDTQARTLAHLARLRQPTAPDAAADLFAEALAAVRRMTAELDQETLGFVTTSSMVTQTAVESRWVAGRTPYDTIGAKARALADVAGEMAVCQDPRAEATFDEAEAVAALIEQNTSGAAPGRFMLDSDLAGAGKVFHEHTLAYIEARRHSGPQPPPQEPPPAEVEQRLLAAETIPVDRAGFYPRALLRIAATLVDNDEPDQARPLLDRAEVAATGAEGGFQAELFWEIAQVWRRLDDNAQAQQLEKKAVELAADERDFPTSYRAWLAVQGRDVVLELRDIAAARGMIQKRRFYSDRALAQMAVSLATDDADDALVLVDNIQDPYQRVRALAAIIGHTDVNNVDADARLFSQLDRTLAELPDEQKDIARFAAVELLVERADAKTQPLIDQITDPGRRTLAMVLIAQHSRTAAAWEAAWSAAETSAGDNASLALALARLAEHWYELEDVRAVAAIDRAQMLALAAESASARADALIMIAQVLIVNDQAHAAKILGEAEQLAEDIPSRRGRGHTLARIAAVWMDLAPATACRLLAQLRLLGRDNFLDGVAQVAPGMARHSGPSLLHAVAEALDQANLFLDVGVD